PDREQSATVASPSGAKIDPQKPGGPARMKRSFPTQPSMSSSEHAQSARLLLWIIDISIVYRGISLFAIRNRPLLKAFGPATALLLLSIFLGGCGNQTGAIESLGDAYAGAAHVPLYNELEANPKQVGELQFGDAVHLVRRRRNFYFVQG